MGKPKRELDAVLIEKLASIHCTMIEIAAVLNCSVDTLERRFAEVIKRGQQSGKMSLRRKMFELAHQGNVTMLIWLSKQHLGFSEKTVVENYTGELTRPEKVKQVMKAVDEVLTTIKSSTSNL